ncbi:uncharacterized protein PG986_010504 [Apiospora aurea]|uniref:Uncharacterized protein n=1 Tax=Apiospora aurea TaxID=335848 RepID=A0ABR1Q2E9_9PEZI
MYLEKALARPDQHLPAPSSQGLIHHAVSTYLTRVLPAHPDVLKRHLEFTRASECADGILTITQIKLGRLTSHLKLVLNPVGGFPHEDISDAWNRLLPPGDDRMDAMYLAVMADIFPSLSDTGLRSGGMWDTRAHFRTLEAWVA